MSTPSTPALHQDEMTHTCTLDTKTLNGIGFEVKGLGLRYTRTQKGRTKCHIRYLLLGSSNARVQHVAITLCWLVSEINWNTYSSLGMFMCVSAEYVGGLCQYDHVCDREALKLTDSVAS